MIEEEEDAKMQLGKLTVVLCCVWVVTIFYGEMFAFWVPSSSSSWPQLLPASKVAEVIESLLNQRKISKYPKVFLGIMIMAIQQPSHEIQRFSNVMKKNLDQEIIAFFQFLRMTMSRG